MDRTRNLSVGLLFSIARKRRKKSVSSSSASKFGWVSFWNLSGIIRESFANLPVDPGAVDFSLGTTAGRSHSKNILIHFRRCLEEKDLRIKMYTN